MREVVTVQVGGAGNRIGTKFYENLCLEHGVLPNGQYAGESLLQLMKLDSFFDEGNEGFYTAKNLMCDMDIGSIDHILNQNNSKIYGVDNMIYERRSGAIGNYAKAYYNNDNLVQVFQDRYRRTVEKCENLNTVKFVHSLTGGTGSGLASRFQEKVKDDFSGGIIANDIVLPNLENQESPYATYNCVQAMQHLIEHSSIIFNYENESMFNIVRGNLGFMQPYGFSDVNNLIAQCMCNVSSSMRFPGNLNADYRKIATNLVPFPRMKACYTKNSPNRARNDVDNHSEFNKVTTSEIIEKLFDFRYHTYKNIRGQSFPIAMHLVLRGNFDGCGIEENVKKCWNGFIGKHHSYHDNFSMAFVKIPAFGTRKTATNIINDASFGKRIEMYLEQFSKLLRKKAYIWHFLQEGMDEMEFTEAESNLNDLSWEYKGCMCTGYLCEGTSDYDQDEYEDDESIEEEELFE